GKKRRICPSPRAAERRRTSVPPEDRGNEIPPPHRPTTSPPFLCPVAAERRRSRRPEAEPPSLWHVLDVVALLFAQTGEGAIFLALFLPQPPPLQLALHGEARERDDD